MVITLEHIAFGEINIVQGYELSPAASELRAQEVEFEDTCVCVLCDVLPEVKDMHLVPNGSRLLQV